jgi:hypothetical protein
MNPAMINLEQLQSVSAWQAVVALSAASVVGICTLAAWRLLPEPHRKVPLLLLVGAAIAAPLMFINSAAWVVMATWNEDWHDSVLAGGFLWGCLTSVVFMSICLTGYALARRFRWFVLALFLLESAFIAFMAVIRATDDSPPPKKPIVSESSTNSVPQSE